MKTRIITENAPKAIGPYSQAVAWEKLLFCSGQIPLVPSTMELQPAEIRVQTRQVLENLKGVLLAGKSSPDKIVKTTVFLTDLKNFEIFNQEYQKFFDENGTSIPPARSTIQVSALPKAALVEIEAIALRE